MRIGIDLDNVICNTSEAVEKAINGKFKFTKYWVKDCIGSPKEKKAAIDLLNDVEFMTSLRIENDVKSCIQTLAINHWVFVVTAREAFKAPNTASWLWRELEGLTGVIFEANKGNAVIGMKLDYFIEDSTDNALEVAMAGAKSILLRKPWNINDEKVYSGIKFVDCLGEAVEYIAGGGK